MYRNTFECKEFYRLIVFVYEISLLCLLDEHVNQFDNESSGGDGTCRND